DVHGEFGDLLGFLAGEQEEVGVAGGVRGQAGVDAVGVDDDAGLLGLAEDLREPYAGDGGGGEQVAQHLAGADGGQLVDVADEQQVGAGRDRLDELVGEQQVEHGRLV